MAAPTGNLNAEKWTIESLCPLLEQIEEMAFKTEAHFIGTLLVQFRISRKAWCYWRKKFSEEPEISARMDLIEETLEQRLVEDALEGKIKPAMAMFCLKCHHTWPSPGPNRPVREAEEPAPPKAPRPRPEPEPEPEPEPIRVEMPDGSVMVFPCRRDPGTGPGRDIFAPRQQDGTDFTKPG